jgi:hypothetical protein
VAELEKGTTMTDTLRSTFSAEPRTDPAKPFWFAPACAVLGATAVWLVVVPAAGIELFVETGGTTTEVSAASVVVGSALGGLGAVALGWVARRWFPHPRRDFVVLTSGMLVLSLLSPAAAATSMATAWSLCAMHVVVGAVAISLVAGPLPGHADPTDTQE